MRGASNGDTVDAGKVSDSSSARNLSTIDKAAPMTALFGHGIVQAVVGAGGPISESKLASKAQRSESCIVGYEVQVLEIVESLSGESDTTTLSLKIGGKRFEKSFALKSSIQMLIACINNHLIDEDSSNIGRKFDILYGYPVQSLSIVSKNFVVEKREKDPNFSDEAITFEDIGLVTMSCQVKLY